MLLEGRGSENLTEQRCGGRSSVCMVCGHWSRNPFRVWHPRWYGAHAHYLIYCNIFVLRLAAFQRERERERESEKGRAMSLSCITRAWRHCKGGAIASRQNYSKFPIYAGPIVTSIINIMIDISEDFRISRQQVHANKMELTCYHMMKSVDRRWHASSRGLLHVRFSRGFFSFFYFVVFHFFPQLNCF